MSIRQRAKRNGSKGYLTPCHFKSVYYGWHAPQGCTAWWRLSISISLCPSSLFERWKRRPRVWWEGKAIMYLEATAENLVRRSNKEQINKYDMQKVTGSSQMFQVQTKYCLYFFSIIIGYLKSVLNSVGASYEATWG